MSKQMKVGFATKILSNRNYIKEVSVEGKTTNKFNFSIGFYDQYASQIIRIGNCITLLSNDITINKDNFWNPNYFEDLTRYVFWTFNKSFLFTLTEATDTLSPSIIKRCALVLLKNLIPYSNKLEETSDEELHWCLVKNQNFKEDPKFQQMYLLDRENRMALMAALSAKITSFDTQEKALPKTSGETLTTEPSVASFLDVLKPLNNNPNETLHYMVSKLEEAKFELKLLSKVDKRWVTAHFNFNIFTG